MKGQGKKISIKPGRIRELAKLAGRKILRRLVRPIIRAAKRAAGYGEAPGPKIDKRHKIGPEEWSDSGRWVHVHSSNVSGIKYDAEKELLFVEFLAKGRSKGSIYVYYRIPDRLAKGMFDAPSVGKYLHWQIKVKGYNYAPLR